MSVIAKRARELFKRRIGDTSALLHVLTYSGATMRVTAFLTLLLISPATPVDARNTLVTVMEVGAKSRGMMSVDLDTLKDVGGLKRAWVFSAVRVPRREDSVSNALVEVDCSQERSRYLQRNYYKPDHSFDMRGSISPEWEYAAPDSRFYTVIAAICGKPSQEALRMGDKDPFELADRIFAAKPAN